MPGPEIVLIRHAQSEWNASGRWQGHADPPLSAQGERQARQLADELAGLEIHRLLCSDLARARRTALVLAAARGLEPEVDPVFRELDIGAWEGLQREQIEARDPQRLARFDAEELHVAPPSGESRAAIRARARAALEPLARAPASQRIAIVTHLGFVRALVPDATLPNAGWLRMRARDLLALRGRPSAGPIEAC